MAYQISPPQSAVVTMEAVNSVLGIASNTVVKAAPGVVGKVSVTTALTAAATIIDSATVVAATAANTILVTGTTVAVGTVIELDWPCQNGITILTTTGALAVSFT